MTRWAWDLEGAQKLADALGLGRPDAKQVPHDSTAQAIAHLTGMSLVAVKRGLRALGFTYDRNFRRWVHATERGQQLGLDLPESPTPIRGIS